MFCQIQRHVKKIFSVYYVRRQGIIFDVVGFQRRFHENFFVIVDAYLMSLCQYVQFPFVQHTYRIKDVGLILKVFFQLLVFVA